MAASSDPGLLAAVRHTLGGAFDLVTSLAGLLVCEARVAGRRATTRLVIAGIALGLAAGGAVMIAVAVAVFVGRQLGDPWLGVAVLGAVALVAGLITARVMGRRILAEDLSLPITRAEIRKDLEWLRDQRADS